MPRILPSRLVAVLSLACLFRGATSGLVGGLGQAAWAPMPLRCLEKSREICGAHVEDLCNHGTAALFRLGLRLRGGIGEAAGSITTERTAGIMQEVVGNEYREFGTGPPNVDQSGTIAESKPDSFNQSDSLMDGMGGLLWNHNVSHRLIGEHFPARVGHRVRVSPDMREFWQRHNFTDHWDGWDHQSDRLGTIIGITDDGTMCEVCWDEEGPHQSSVDWYSTGYLAQYYLSLAEDELQPEWPDYEIEKIKRMEAKLAAMKENYEKTGIADVEDSDKFSEGDVDYDQDPLDEEAEGDDLSGEKGEAPW